MYINYQISSDYVLLLDIRFNKSALCSEQITVRVETYCVLCITVIQYEVAKRFGESLVISLS
jgi:hypothetical protein